jgi:hypothetical protein
MATPTYTLIDSTVLGSAASSVTFSGISATGKGDLVLVVDSSGSNNFADSYVRFNSDTGNNYSAVYMRGNGSTGDSGQTTRAEIQMDAYMLTGQRANGILQIMDFAESKHKTTLGRGNAPTSLVYARAGRWANTAAITSIEVRASTGTYDSGSSFYLYQIVSE